MSADVFLPLVVGDYLKNTQHLDAQRHGCYLLWLMHYWVKGPLRDCIDDLIILGRLRGADAPSIAQALLEEFFTLSEDGKWHNKRSDREKEAAVAKSLEAIRKAQKAANSRWERHAPSSPSSNAQAMPERCSSSPYSPLNANTLSSDQPDGECASSPIPKSAPTIKNPIISTSDCEAIYRAYPKHVGKKDAVTKIRLALLRIQKDGLSPEWLLDRVKLFANQRKNEDSRYTPNPAKWFDQGRYDDDALAGVSTRPRYIPTINPNLGGTNK